MGEAPRIIGLSGKARHGKDSAFEFINEVLTPLGYDVRRIGFADAVKTEATEQGWNGVKDEAGRSLLQRIGAARREENPNYWIDRTMEKIHAEFMHRTRNDGPILFVITDVRYPNEFENIMTEGGLVWRIERRNPLTHGTFNNGLTEEQKAHPSETSLDDARFQWFISAEDLSELGYMVLRGLEQFGFL